MTINQIAAGFFSFLLAGISLLTDYGRAWFGWDGFYQFLTANSCSSTGR